VYNFGKKISYLHLSPSLFNKSTQFVQGNLPQQKDLRISCT